MKSNNFIPLSKRKRAYENSKHTLISWKCWALMHRYFKGDLNALKSWFQSEIDIFQSSPTIILQRQQGEELLKYIKYTYFKNEEILC